MTSSNDEAPSHDRRPIVAVSNRLPVVASHDSDGDWVLESGSGGLITALEPVLKRGAAGTWVGWAGTDETDLDEVQRVLDQDAEGRGYRLRAIGLSEEEQEGFYLGFSNQVIWPLFHGFPERCNFLPRFWDIYAEVNRKFARGVGAHLGGDELIWIHDYHLMGVAEVLRRQGVRQPIGFFLHTPVPAPDLLRKLPWRLPLLRSLLHYDLVGFQTNRDRENFLHALRSILPRSGVERDGELYRIRMGPRVTNVGVFPIAIDVPEFADVAARESVRQEAMRLRGELPGYVEEDPDSHIMLLGVDRLDYTKGLPQKLRAFQMALRRHPELHRRVTLVQLVVPSREDIPAYHSLKREVERLVGEICGEFNEAGWCPIRYEYGQWDRERLVAHYRAARVALVTPLQDGMNLVAKEYCAAHVEGDGVLVLSEHAGAAAQFHLDALLVNPYHVEGLAWAIYRACTMPPEERRARMGRLRAGVRRHDIHWWADAFLKAAAKGSSRRARREARLASRAPDPRRTGAGTVRPLGGHDPAIPLDPPEPRVHGDREDAGGGGGWSGPRPVAGRHDQPGAG